MKFVKVHAYGNDFLYIRNRDVASGVALDALARELYDLIAVTSTADAHESTAEGALRDLGLKWPQCLDSLSSVLAVDLKPDLDPDSN